MKAALRDILGGLALLALLYEFFILLYILGPGH